MRIVDADALKEQFKDKEGNVFTAFHFYEAIDNAPAIEEHKGTWIQLRNGNVECSECYVEQPVDSYYCPWCGAKMELPGLMKSIKQWEEAVDKYGYIN